MLSDQDENRIPPQVRLFLSTLDKYMMPPQVSLLFLCRAQMLSIQDKNMMPPQVGLVLSLSLKWARISSLTEPALSHVNLGCECRCSASRTKHMMPLQMRLSPSLESGPNAQIQQGSMVPPQEGQYPATGLPSFAAVPEIHKV